IGLLSGAILAGAAFGTVKLVEQVSGEASTPVSTEESAGESSAAEPTEEASPEAPVLSADTEVVEDGVKYTDFRIRHDAYGNPIREVSAAAAAEKADESVTSLSIRNSVEGYRVTRIEEGFGRAYPNLKELTLSCEVVSESAFVDCTGLESVTLTKGVKLVEERAFYNLNQLSNITIDPSVTRIWGNAFDQTGYYLNKENWQGDFLILGDLLLSATGHVSATDYVIPEGIRTLAIDSFSATGGVWLLESSSVRIPYSLENGLETSSALCYLSLILPEDHPVYRLEGIWVYRRSDGALAGVLPHHGGGELPKDGSLKSVGAYAFFAVDPILGRMELEMPDSVVTVEDYAFYEGESIQLSHLPTSLRTVGRGAFRFVAFLEFEIPRSLETVGAYAFEHCGLEGEVLIPNTLRNLERDENGDFYPIFFGNDITLKLEAGNPAFEGMEEEEVIRQLLGK
ncbi:MAG: leucine-rich repeat protein, partial [Clostridia bacterium]|nr:leucine-rich repeat protein [Clostridia bacterium]